MTQRWEREDKTVSSYKRTLELSNVTEQDSGEYHYYMEYGRHSNNKSIRITVLSTYILLC